MTIGTEDGSVKQGTGLTASDVMASFLISGSLAATFKTTMAPFERIRLILQTQAESRQLSRGFRAAYSGSLDALMRIPKEQGLSSMWRGNFTNICRYFPTQAINFALYDVYFHLLVSHFRPDNIATRDVLSFLAGGSVGVTSCGILYPLTFCTTRLAVDLGDGKFIKREFNGLFDCFRKVLKTDGLRGFYQGLACSLLGTFLYRATYFGFFTSGKRILLSDYAYEPDTHATKAPVALSLLVAQASSSTAILIAYPFDTVARQSMLHSGQESPQYMSLRKMTTKVMRREGVAGFYRGVCTNMVTAMTGSFLLVSYDVVMEYYYNNERHWIEAESKRQT